MNSKMNINNMTIEEKVGQMLMFAFHGTEYSEQLNTQITKLNVGGAIYFARNVDDDIEKVKRLNEKIQSNAKFPLFIGVDQEGGMVTRITNGVTPFPGAMTLSSTQEDITDICYYQGCDLKKAGFNINFAPVADVNNNPYNPVISSRSYSDNPEVVAKFVNQAVSGFKKAGVLTTLKHFPGHGDTSVDSHLSMPNVKKDFESLDKVELYPFKKAIEAGCDGIMAAHILYDVFDKEYPATLSEKIIKQLLREKLGYKGLVVTDSLTMGAIAANFTYEQILTNCVNAGIDIMMFCGKADLNEQIAIYETFVRLVNEGKILEEKVNEAVARIITLKEKYLSTTFHEINHQESFALACQLFDKSVTLAFNKIDVTIKDDEKTLVIFPEIKLKTLVDNETSEYKTLGSFLGNVTEYIITENLENLDLIVQNSKKYDKIIMATLNVKKDDYQAKVFSKLDKEKCVVVSLRSPYDSMHLSGIKNYICLYEVTEMSLKSLAKCLKGEKKFLGKLPVKLVR